MTSLGGPRLRVFKCLTHSPAYCARPKEGLQSQKPKPEDLKLATADFEKAVAADSSYTKAHYRLATALFKQNKIEGALAALGPALVRHMSSATYYLSAAQPVDSTLLRFTIFSVVDFFNHRSDVLSNRRRSRTASRSRPCATS